MLCILYNAYMYTEYKEYITYKHKSWHSQAPSLSLLRYFLVEKQSTNYIIPMFVYIQYSILGLYLLITTIQHITFTLQCIWGLA